MYKNNRNKGITLIALVITIIVMLILVAVTISMAVNGGLFEYAGKAVGDTQNEIDAEQQLANGKIKVGEIWYDSIDDYLNNIPSGTQNAEPDEGDGDGSEEVTPTELSVGDYISNYPVKYDNVGSITRWGTDNYIPDPKFKDGWRVLSVEKDEEGNYTSVRLVSAGVPLSYYHPDYSESGIAATSVANLTTRFLTTEINSSTATKYKFYKCGFENVIGTTLASTFTNDYTDMVQSLTKDDVDCVLGVEVDADSGTIKGEYDDLLSLTSVRGYACFVWLASEYNTESLCYIGEELGDIVWDGDGNVSVYGVRPVVTLKSTVKFSPVSEENWINDTTTWEISL